MPIRRPWAFLFGVAASLLSVAPRAASADERDYARHAIVFRLCSNDRFDARIGDKHLFGEHAREFEQSEHE